MKNKVFLISIMLFMIGCGDTYNIYYQQDAGSDLNQQESVTCKEAYLNPERNVSKLSDNSYQIYESLNNCICNIFTPSDCVYGAFLGSQDYIIEALKNNPWIGPKFDQMCGYFEEKCFQDTGSY
jgi:hypothetical protein